MTYNPKIKNTSNTDMSIDANVDANNITMGDAEDGVWTDGIFAFTNDTKVGTAIDKINELLRGLAPKVPSELDNLSTISAGANAAIYINGTQGYTAITEDNGAENDVADKFTFSKQTSPDFTQLGAYLYNGNNDITINLDLNGNKESDTEGNLTNLRDNAFLAEVGKTLEFKISINGTEVSVDNPLQFPNNEVENDTLNIAQSVNIQSTVDNVTTQYGSINLQPTQYGKFFATQANFTQFVHRTGTVSLIVNEDTFRKGFNYVIVYYKHIDETEWKDLNKVSFFLEHSADRQITSFTQTPALDSNINTRDIKFLSGIKYYKEVGATYYTSQLGSIENFGQHTYSPASNGGITAAVNTGNAFASSTHSFVDANLNGFTYNANSTFSFTGIAGRRHLGAIGSTVTIKDAYSNTRASGTEYVANTTILYDSVTPTSTDLVENFDDEAQRINGDGTTFNSQVMGTNDLIVYNGILCTQGYAQFKNLVTTTDSVEPSQNPLSLNSNQGDWLTYERKLVKQGNFASGTITIEGIPAGYKLIKTTADANLNIKYKICDSSGVEVIKISFNSAAGYRDILTVTEANGTLAGDPAPAGTTEGALFGGNKLQVAYNLLDATTPDGKIKIEMINNGTNKLDKITVTAV